VTLVTALREGLAAAADPANAAAMQSYMKSAMPCRGVRAPERRRVVRTVLADIGEPAERATWESAVIDLWDEAAYREERYVAVDLCAHRSPRRWQTADRVPMYDRMVVSGAWWDLVDAIAISLLGPILRRDPTGVEPIVRSWIGDPDGWRRRTAIIVQNGARAATDTVLLDDAVVANLTDRDVFIRKAIGWALREHARTDPGWVRTFVDRHAADLSSLSRREATKHL
jgi:3-methyladenine DNA glycosylase AlkD